MAASRKFGLQTYAALLAAFIVAASLSACGRASSENGDNRYLTTKVEQRDILIQVSATGVIEPIRIIEIKSKASGEILRLPVETGDVVPAGALLAQVDTTDVAAQVRQSRADLEVARVREAVGKRKLERATDLLSRGMISVDEHDQARLDYATAVANVTRAESDLEQMLERLADTVVRAPSAGTILKKSVERGQIIASVGQVSGGTTLMTMADLSRIQVRAVVDETDVGKIRAGMPASVEVDAYSNRLFEGSIMKIEPESVEQQNITFFPMLIEIDNSHGLLKPGMNANVHVDILRKDDVATLINDAVVTPQSATMVALFLNMDPDTITALLDMARPAMPQDSLRRRPDGRRTPGTERTGEMRRPSGSRSAGTPTAGDPGGDGGVRPGMRRAEGGNPSEEGGASAMMRQSGIGIVFIPDSTGVRPKVVRTGTQNWEITEIRHGLALGDEVLIPPSPSVIMQSERMRERMRQYTAMPGRR